METLFVEIPEFYTVQEKIRNLGLHFFPGAWGSEGDDQLLLLLLQMVVLSNLGVSQERFAGGAAQSYKLIDAIHSTFTALLS